MRLKSYLEKIGVCTSKQSEVSPQQVMDFLSECGPLATIDLSAVTVTGRLFIEDLMFADFNAGGCHFIGGIKIRRCRFGSLNFAGSFIGKIFVLQDLTIDGDLVMPRNLGQLVKKDISELHGLNVKGKIIAV
jgi:hypothetical protein